MSVASPSPVTIDRTALIRDAFRLEYITLAWMTIEAAVAIGSGVTAGSLTLMAFGIELASAAVLVWRLNVELRDGPDCLNNFSASISGTSAGVKLPSGAAAS
jgi:hypothetical protein